MIIDQSPGTYAVVIVVLLGVIGLWLESIRRGLADDHQAHLEHVARHLERKGERCARRAAEDAATGLPSRTRWHSEAAEWFRRGEEIRGRLRGNE